MEVIWAKPRALPPRVLPHPANQPAALRRDVFYRSGLVCLATLSHNARSSSLRLRLRRGGGSNSGINGGRFIGDGDSDNDDNDGVGVPRVSAGSS